MSGEQPQMVAEIEADAASRRKQHGIEPRGMDRIRNQDPLSRPVMDRRSPKPLCHAASKEVRERVVKVYRAFVGMFREASLKVKFGNVAASRFPQKEAFRQVCRCHYWRRVRSAWAMLAAHGPSSLLRQPLADGRSSSTTDLIDAYFSGDGYLPILPWRERFARKGNAATGRRVILNIWIACVVEFGE